MAVLNFFINTCLQRISRIFWPNNISNSDQYKKAWHQNIEREIQIRRLKWLGNVLKNGWIMKYKQMLEMESSWQKEERKSKGRPKEKPKVDHQKRGNKGGQKRPGDELKKEVWDK